MPRKKWTPRSEVNDSILKFREKRKWQIALRRYVLERNKSSAYAPYFGLDIENFRKWIELQFAEKLNWESFSKNWQFDHVIPVTYFDFSDETDLHLCWNFINIMVGRFDAEKNQAKRLDLAAAKRYFVSLYVKTQYSPCFKMVEKINKIEASDIAHTNSLQDFIKDHKNYLETISTFTPYEFEQLNTGSALEEILKQRSFLKQFEQ